MGTARDLRTEAIRQAIGSGEFLQVAPESSTLVSGPVDLDLRRLVDATERYIALCERLENADEVFAAVTQQVRQEDPAIGFRPDVLVYLFAVDDRLIDVLRLSGAMVRHLLNPSVPYDPPQARPISPLEDAVEGLEAEQASHSDVEGWVRDDVIWGLLTDQTVSDPERMNASRQRYPGFWSAVDECVRRRAEEIARRYGPELLRRKQIYGEEAASQWLAQAIEGET